MITKNIYRGVSIAIPILTILVLLGITDSLNFNLNTNLGNTGLFVKYLLAILNGFLLFAIIKKYDI